MLYRNFAIATLVGAPLLVLAVQNVVPRSPAPVEQAAPPSDDAPPPTPPPPVTIAPPTPPAAPGGSADFGQPMAEAGRPSLLPGQGLPDLPASGSAQSYVPGTASAGSPNAEP